MVGCCFGIYVATMSKRAVDEEDKPMAEGVDSLNAATAAAVALHALDHLRAE